MEPSKYQSLAMRTECDQQGVLNRLNIYGTPAVRLIHSVLGMMGELGELAGALERWLWYGQNFDQTNFKEELGDTFWYVALAHNALDLDMLETMRANIAKLKCRYEEKFTELEALEKNRNRKAEANEVSNTHRLRTAREVDEEIERLNKGN